MTDINPTSQQEVAACDPINVTFTTPDLVLNIIRPLIDARSLPALISLSTVSTNFLQIMRTSETFWQELCRQRWKDKWGFHRRWEEAVKHHDMFNECKERIGSGVTFWRERYFEEEQDATRRSIGLRELNSLTFDFRFWIGQPTVVDERIVVKSGLLQSASRDVRFHWKEEEDRQVEEGIEEEWFSYRGEVTGHPCREETGIVWFMNQSSVIQWGFLPNLWPKGEIRRTENWGWEIRNPNVVMRAIDPLPSADYDHATEDGNDLNNVDYGLWKDLIDSLENVPMRNAPEVNGYPVTAELPRSFLDHPFVE